MEQTDGYRAIELMWRATDLVECLILISLALALAYTVFVTARFFRRYVLAGPTAYSESLRSRNDLIAELTRGVRTLKAIASAAPFLGLAGTAYGILALFSSGFVEARDPFVVTVPLEISTSLVATASGLIVATTAAVCCNIFGACLERIGSKRSSALLEAAPRSYGFAQTLALRKRFTGMPAFALIGAPVLGILVPMYELMMQAPIPVGLPVRLLRIGATDHDSDAIVISLIGPDSGGIPTVYVNSNKTPWSELGQTLRRQLEVRPDWVVYVDAEDKVRWQHVAYAVDVARGLRAQVVLLTAEPGIRADTVPEKKNKKKPRMK